MNVVGTEVRHGYTMNRLHLIARKAAETAHAQAQPFAERYETAWQAIAEHLCGSEDPPQFYELIITGRIAIDEEVRQVARSHGRYLGNASGGSEHIQSFSRYWDWHIWRPGSPEDQVIDPLALRQIWPQLSAAHRAALTAPAIHDDYAMAAASLGKNYNAFYHALRKARRQFMALWHEGETPPSRITWTTDIRATSDRTATTRYRYTVAQTVRNKRNRKAGQAGGS